jgi:cell shape-determining protein MreC
MLPDELVVPGAAVSVIRKGLSDAGVPAIGYFAQVPHYLNRPFHAGVLGLLERVGKQVGSPLAVGDLAEKAQRQRREIDLMLEEREDAREYVERLERINETELPAPRFEQLPTADEIAAEVERYLKQASDGEE